MNTRLFLCLVPFVIAASCGGTIAPGSDAGSDASFGGACSTSADCPNGGDCAYPDNGGCSAQKKCFPPKAQCKSMPLCACDGTTTGDDCNGGAQKPIAHTGLCIDASGPPMCGTLTCENCDVTVVAQVKPNDATNACSQQDIASFVTACISPSATQASCTAWEQGDAGAAECGTCIITHVTGATWGPLICDSIGCTINVGGCIDIVSGQVVIENGTNGSCGDLTSAFDQCIDSACAACTSSPSESAACSNDAQQGVCKSYFDAAQTSSTCALVDAGPNACSPQSDSDWASFINLFCGTGP